MQLTAPIKSMLLLHYILITTNYKTFLLAVHTKHDSTIIITTIILIPFICTREDDKIVAKTAIRTDAGDTINYTVKNNNCSNYNCKNSDIQCEHKVWNKIHSSVM
jgi:hypothetical protein